ncbi:ATP:cob(I)alamin adenosyltransferase, partial [Lactobacillus sp. XV13L]|nr:ATP:cob(I)alamin adenosyltransferase [Lactobacillus sp. XV13L]
RTVCRRAERLFVKLSDTVKFRSEVERYINRLSDFLYIMARAEDYEELISQVTDRVCERYLQLKDA